MRWIVPLLLLSEIAVAKTGWREGRMYLDVETDIYSSNSNYDNFGEFERLNGNNSYANTRLESQLIYNFDPRIAFLSRLVFSHANSVGSDADRKDAQFSDLHIGAQYLAFNKKWKLIPRLEIIAPLNNFDAGTDKVMINEGSLQIKATLHFRRRFGFARTYGHFGIQHRDGGRSMLVPFRLIFESSLKTLVYGGGFKGFFSGTQDSFTEETTTRTNVTNRVNGGSVYYYAVNPSAVDFEIYGGFKIRPDMIARLGFATSVNGQNYARGNSLLLSFFTYFDAFAKKSVVQRQRHRDKNRRKKVDDFEEKTQDVDDELFQDDFEQRQYYQNPRKEKSLLDDTEKELEKRYDDKN